MNVADRSKALSYFIGAGWTPAQAAGIVANLVAESNLNPAAVGDGGQAYGIAQWHPDRQAGFAGQFGHPIQGSTLDEQLAWVDSELRGPERKAGDALLGCTTAAEAGACVSKMYERPADREGEAARRGALAESILQQSGGAPAAPAAPEKPPMGALALPFLQTILPSVIGLFSGRAQAQISKATGASPDAAAAFFQNLMGQVSAAAGIPIPDDPGQARAAAIQAVAAVTKPEAGQQVADLEQHALDYLDKLSPMLDKLADIELKDRAASVVGMDAAAKRAQGERWDMTRSLVWMAGLTAFLVVVGLTATIIYQAVTGEQQIDTGLVGIAGPLLAIALGVWREIFAYRFDGSKASEAQTTLAATIADASKRGAR